MKHLIIGLGKSGLAAGKYLQKKGEKVIGYDERLIDAPFETTASLDLSGIDQIVLSPGFDPRCRFIESAQKKGIPIIGEMELGLRDLNGFCIGITGSNGKTTTCLLLEHFCKKAGKSSRVLGNIGKPICSYLLEKVVPSSIYILEISSFQLETLEKKAFDLVGFLPICPNHLDRYNSFSEYKKTKLKLGSLIKPLGKVFAPYSLRKDLPSSLEVGSHPLLLAKRLAKELGISPDEKGFFYPEHRLEKLATWKGIHFYNDSKSTTPESTLYAVKNCGKKIFLLCGGSDKNLEYTTWIKGFSDQVIKVFAVGSCGEKIANTLQSYYNVVRKNTLKEAFYLAVSFAKPGDTILLSPGSASYDEFSNYEERGKAFKKWVNSLKDKSI